MAYERVDGANYGLVVIHAKSGEGATTDGTNPMTVSAAPGTELVNLMPEGPRTVTVGAGGAVTVSLGPWQSAVFVPRAQVR
jgi:hypothetical protein